MAIINPIKGLNSKETMNIKKPLLPLLDAMCAGIRLKNSQKNTMITIISKSQFMKNLQDASRFSHILCY